MTEKLVYIAQTERYTNGGQLEDEDVSEAFISKEEANDEAEMIWNHFTKREKKISKVYVIKLKESDYLKVLEGETDECFDEFAIDEDGLFDSVEFEEANKL